MSLKQFLKGYGLLLLAVLALLGVSGVTMYGFGQLMGLGNSLYAKGFVQVEKIAELNVRLKEQLALVQKAPAEMDLTKLAKDKTEFKTLAEKINAGLEAVGAGQQIGGKSAAETYAGYVAAGEKVFGFAELFAQNQAVKQLNEQALPVYEKIDAFVAERMQEAEQVAEKSLRKMEKTGGNLTVLVGVIAAALVVLVGGIGGYLGWQQSRHEGETRRVVTEVQDVLSDVTTATNEMEGQATSMAAASTQAGTSVKSVSSVMEETSASMASVSAAVEELAATISEIQHQAGESQAKAGEAIGEVQKANSTVGEMARSVTQISSFVETITDIANQTNLLALNAAIEAARAGDAGRGFAVVADEVRKLATQTNTAAEQIVQQINTIEHVSAQVVTAIELASETIGQVTGTVEQVSRAVSEQSLATQDISRSVQEVTSGVETASSDLHELSSMVNNVNDESANLRMCSNELSNKTGQLQDKVKDFMRRVVS